MASDDTPTPPKRGESIRELAEDAVGFGAAEFRLTRDLFRRPRAVMNAYDAHGSTAGGLYPKPFRYWLTVNGLYLLFMALTGGYEKALQGGGANEQQGLSLFARASGKSADEFQSDLEQWMSMVSLPCYALIVGGALFLLFRRWSLADDRVDFRQTFTFLNAWTMWTLPIGLIGTFLLPYEVMISLSAAVALIAIPLVFSVFGGGGRWWRTRRGAWVKGVVLVIVSVLSFLPFSLLAAGVALVGAVFLP